MVVGPCSGHTAFMAPPELMVDWLYRTPGVHALHLGLTESHALCTAASYALLE
jgi:hypothetical protein